MSSQPHLQIVNPSQSTQSEGSSFSPFPLLPKELRLNIWRHALQRHRIIQVRLESLRGEKDTEAALTSGPPKPYRIFVDGCQLLSKLLRVNRESRDEALEFYRVHLPCIFTRGPFRERRTSHGTLRFNPEYDFLQIDDPGWPLRDTLFEFLYRLKTAHDPQNVGLLNLAVSHNALCNLHLVHPRDLDSKVKEAFVETLTHLHEVFFVSTPRVGRQVKGPLSGLPTDDTFFNRSFPIMAMPPTFDRLHRDTRPITQDLKRVLTTGGSDARHMVQNWQNLLDGWQISPLGIEYRFLVAYDPTLARIQISDRESAKQWLQQDEDLWNGLAPKEEGWPDLKWPVGAEHEDWKNEDLEKAVRPAFGFWLFPLEALGPLREEGVPKNKGFRSRGKVILDMTDYWPELALTSLP